MRSQVTLESIAMNKASAGDGILVELFQILKDDALKVLHTICQQIWKTQQWPQDWKRAVFIPFQSPKIDNAKECSNYRTIALISHAIKVMLKISKLDFNSTWIVNFQMFKLDLEGAEEPEIKVSTSIRSSKKQKVPGTHPLLLYWLCQSIVWIITNCGTFLKKWEYHITWAASWEICMEVRKQQLELDMKQQTGSK